MNEFYLYLSSWDSLKIRKNNNPSDCYVQLPKSYILEGRWLCALTESTLTCDFTPRSKRLYLCSDIVEESYVREALLPVIRNIEIETRYKKLKSDKYHHPVYLPVRINHLSAVRLYMIDENLNQVDFKTNDLHCVLHFKKASWAL